MAKGKKTIKNKQKSIKRDVKHKINNMSSSADTDWYKVSLIIFGVFIFLALFYLLTVVIVGRDTEKKPTDEVTIQYDEILAGSSFNMKDVEYLVVYYDRSDDDLSKITSAISSYHGLKLYYVDMSSGLNKRYATEKEANRSPQEAKDLAVNGPTLIKISDGNVLEYIEGTDKIVEYLK